ncbi:MAG: TetR/AcrR family transcriptional regulator [Deltaproteobacteria bacterium]|nr:TetR/AcrR family transcriptional regulator [Deltaproteobacteria bacterium]MBW2595079.1 TetR/AcrR family transcriptional regulator [Deltaproteobacteria bacterium]MBW2649431.1 TetR/AcrR family transcriptional regulator [Deltaproteobacteria bacterium]
MKNNKQEIIVEAALEVFRDKGYANTRMADIARRAGVSYGLVYHYFAGKEVLFDVIVEGWWGQLYQMLKDEGASDTECREKLENIIKFFLDTYAEEPNLVSIFVTEVSRSSVYHTAGGLAKFRTFFSLTEEIMREGQKKGFLRSDIGPHYLTYIFLGAIEAFISIMVLGKEEVTRERRDRTINGIIKVFLFGAGAD